MQVEVSSAEIRLILKALEEFESRVSRLSEKRIEEIKRLMDKLSNAK
jgi:hypothetical protein